MRLRYTNYLLLVIFAGAASAQIVLDPNPARVLGHPPVTPAEQLLVTNINPNLGAKGGLYEPTGVAVDITGSAPILYVADTFNNRILAWKNATSATLTNLQAPDLVLGQPDSNTTFPNSNGGLYYPSGLLVDPKGNLYVADAGNNRVLRYPAPFANTAHETPDIVLGQPDKFTSRRGNQGGSPSAQTLCLALLQPGDPYCPSGAGPFIASMAMDSNGNLFVADAGNSRVLRFPSSSLTSGATDPAADIVIGQASFTAVVGPMGQTDRNVLLTPAGLAFDAEGHLFVTDGVNRLVVYPASVSSPTATSNIAAIRLAGFVTPPSPTATASTLSAPNGIAIINDGPAVVDTGNNRVLIFDSFSSADWATTDSTMAVPPPVATAVIGQGSALDAFTTSSRNNGNQQPSATSMWSPFAIAVAGTDLFVADSGNNRVLVFPTAGQAAAATIVLGQKDFPYNSINYIQGQEFNFGTGGSGDAGLAIDSSSATPHLYVSDPGNNRVLGFADARKIGPGLRADIVIGQPNMQTAVCNFGGVYNSTTLGSQPTQSSLCYPTGLAVDPGTGDLFVADTRNGRVLRFPAPFDPANSSQQADLVLGQEAFTGVSNPQASQSVTVSPYGLVLDPNSGLFVSDLSANRVLLFPLNDATNGEPATKVIGQSSFTATAATVLSSPHHIALDTINQLYIADTNHNQVLVFVVPSGSSSTIPTNTYTGTQGGGGLYLPKGVWVNTQTIAGYHNDIWVADSNGLSRFPTPNPLGNSSTATLTEPAVEVEGGQSLSCPGSGVCGYPALAVVQDGAGNLYAADTANRVAVRYQALAATNGANFFCAMGCNVGGLNDPQYYLAPGAFASIFPFNGNTFASTSTNNKDTPIDTTLGNIQVQINGHLSPITTVAQSQINFIVPFEAPQSGTASVIVVNTSTSQVLGSGTLTMNAASPAFFTQNQSGTGPISALNCNTIVNGACDDTLNSTANPALPGSTIQLFLTGQGLISGAPPDGAGECAQVPTGPQPLVLIGGSQATVSYSGLAPCYAGLWQINAEIPKNPVQPYAGFAVGVFPVLVQYQGLTSNTKANNANPATATTIVIKAPS
ncbi:MAG TPA: hypothetical protein VMI94_08600 [Bryobacteraceae bacterium]|nr:hypothetical protein [Bryobacteraceae bacterium]